MYSYIYILIICNICKPLKKAVSNVTVGSCGHRVPCYTGATANSVKLFGCALSEMLKWGGMFVWLQVEGPNSSTQTKRIPLRAEEGAEHIAIELRSHGSMVAQWRTWPVFDSSPLIQDDPRSARREENQETDGFLSPWKHRGFGSLSHMRTKKETRYCHWNQEPCKI